jgi:hypothetical protein
MASSRRPLTPPGKSRIWRRGTRFTGASRRATPATSRAEGLRPTVRVEVRGAPPWLSVAG